MERRRRVQHPLQGLDQFRYHNAVVPHLDDLRLGREPRDGEARAQRRARAGAMARGASLRWGGASAGGVLWRARLFEAMLHFRPGRLARRPAPLANRLDAAFEPCGTHQRSHDRSGAAAARRAACLLHRLVELLGLGNPAQALSFTPGGRRRAEAALRDEELYFLPSVKVSRAVFSSLSGARLKRGAGAPLFAWRLAFINIERCRHTAKFLRRRVQCTQSTSAANPGGPRTPAKRDARTKPSTTRWTPPTQKSDSSEERLSSEEDPVDDPKDADFEVPDDDDDEDEEEDFMEEDEAPPRRRRSLPRGQPDEEEDAAAAAAGARRSLTRMRWMSPRRSRRRAAGAPPSSRRTKTSPRRSRRPSPRRSRQKCHLR